MRTVDENRLKHRTIIVWAVYAVAVVAIEILTILVYQYNTQHPAQFKISKYTAVVPYTIIGITQKVDVNGKQYEDVMFRAEDGAPAGHPSRADLMMDNLDVNVYDAPETVKEHNVWDVNTDVYYQDTGTSPDNDVVKPVVKHNFKYLKESLSSAELTSITNKGAEDFKNGGHGLRNTIFVLVEIALGGIAVIIVAWHKSAKEKLKWEGKGYHW